MTDTDIQQLQALIHDGLKDANHFNQLYLGVGTLLGVFIGMGVQLWIARRSRASNERLAIGSAVLQRKLTREQLEMQEQSSKRIARDNIGAKRQVWIDNLREDVAEYLTVWQQVNWLWMEFTTDAFPEVSPFMEGLDRLKIQSHKLNVRIQLRLNPAEHKHKRLSLIMRLLEERAEGFTVGMDRDLRWKRQDKFDRLLARAIIVTQAVLKEEWNRIKSEALSEHTSV